MVEKRKTLPRNGTFIRITSKQQPIAERFDKYIHCEEERLSKKGLKADILWQIIEKYLDDGGFYDQKKINDFWDKGRRFQFKEEAQNPLEIPGEVEWDVSITSERKNQKLISKELPTKKKSKKITLNINAIIEKYTFSAEERRRIFQKIYTEWFRFHEEILQYLSNNIELFVRFLWDEKIFLRDIRFRKILSDDYIKLLEIGDNNAINRDKIITDLCPFVTNVLCSEFKQEFYVFLVKSEIFTNIEDLTLNPDKFSLFLPNILSIYNVSEPSIRYSHEEAPLFRQIYEENEIHEQKIETSSNLEDRNELLRILEMLNFIPNVIEEGKELQNSKIEESLKESIKEGMKGLFLESLLVRSISVTESGSPIKIRGNMKTFPKLKNIFYIEDFFDYCWRIKETIQVMQNLFILLLKNAFLTFSEEITFEIHRQLMTQRDTLSNFNSLFIFLENLKEISNKGNFASKELNEIDQGLAFIDSHFYLAKSLERKVLSKFQKSPINTIGRFTLIQQMWKRFKKLDIFTDWAKSHSSQLAYAYFGSGSKLSQSELIVIAEKMLQKSLKLNQKDTMALVELSYVFRAQKKYDNAISLLLEAIEHNPEFVEFWTELGKNYSGKGNFEQAVSTFRKALELAPDNDAALCGLGDCLVSMKQFDEAISTFKRAISLNPQKTICRFRLFTVYRDLARFDAAETEMQKMREIDPNDWELWEVYGSFLQQQGKYEEAITAFKTELEKAPDEIHIWLDIASVYTDQGNYEEMRNSIQKIFDKEPDDIGVKEPYGKMLMDLKHYNEAIQQFEEILVRNPKDSRAMFYLAKVYALQKNPRKSIEYLTKSLWIEPTGMFMALNDPDFENIRQDPEFQKLMEEIKIREEKKSDI